MYLSYRGRLLKVIDGKLIKLYFKVTPHSFGEGSWYSVQLKKLTVNQLVF